MRRRYHAGHARDGGRRGTGQQGRPSSPWARGVKERPRARPVVRPEVAVHGLFVVFGFVIAAFFPFFSIYLQGRGLSADADRRRDRGDRARADHREPDLGSLRRHADRSSHGVPDRDGRRGCCGRGDEPGGRARGDHDRRGDHGRVLGGDGPEHRLDRARAPRRRGHGRLRPAPRVDERVLRARLPRVRRDPATRRRRLGDADLRGRELGRPGLEHDDRPGPAEARRVARSSRDRRRRLPGGAAVLGVPRRGTSRVGGLQRGVELHRVEDRERRRRAVPDRHRHGARGAARGAGDADLIPPPGAAGSPDGVRARLLHLRRRVSSYGDSSTTRRSCRC